MAHDMDHLKEVIAYKNTDYRKAPVVRDPDGRILIRPDEEMIRVSGRDATQDFAYAVPVSYIRFLGKQGFRLFVTGHLYTNRFSLEKREDQEVNAYLQNERTGKYIQIPLVRIRSEYVTKAKYSRDDEVHYNYDEAGFRLALDFEDIASDDDFLGKNLIVLSYKTSLFSGYRVLRGFSPEARKNSVDMMFLIGDRHIKLIEEMDGSMAVYVDSSADDVSMKAAVRSLREERQSLLEENAALMESNENAIRRYQELLWQKNLCEKAIEKTKKKLNDIRAEYDLKNQIFESVIDKAESIMGRMESAAEKLEKTDMGIRSAGSVQTGKPVSDKSVYTVIYHCDDLADPSPVSTAVKYGTLTKTKTVSELGFEKQGKSFAGWSVYREEDDSWYLKDSSGRNAFKKLPDEVLPEGHGYVLYKDGESVKYTAKSGIVHFYAQWR